jgi:hypothetical protein
MSKLALLPLTLCVLLAGCTVFKKSRAWDTVMRSRPDLRTAADPSAAYANHLHRVLSAEGIEHKIVSYEFRYRTLLREEAMGSRMAVIYRDDANPANPWWIMDERQSRPIWLPNGPVEKQVTFFIRARAEIVGLRDYSSEGESKTVVAPESPRTAFRTRREESLRAVALGPEEAAPGVRWAQLFRSRHGTAFDPGSPLDRRKMSALQSRD